ncbi:PREDICTED: proline-rich receptor-like protein kinase PERK9 [Wasmannia auropunctata]|uniref:proline-rich receptor-like protein kinase PERK9 n=1 Tax=Wasmannia auropunctata TaxID=64793 RepID=UPI0005EF43E0|nr:PREDICTED: proline-rich receptor-like protein kinase PERK9 [Wasmannia auropunctata]
MSASIYNSNLMTTRVDNLSSTIISILSANCQQLVDNLLSSDDHHHPAGKETGTGPSPGRKGACRRSTWEPSSVGPRAYQGQYLDPGVTDLQWRLGPERPPAARAPVARHRSPPPSAPEICEGRRLDPGVSFLPWRLILVDLPDERVTRWRLADPRPRPVTTQVSRSTQTGVGCAQSRSSLAPLSPLPTTPQKPRTPGRPRSPVRRWPPSPRLSTLQQPRTPARPPSPLREPPATPDQPSSLPAESASLTSPPHRTSSTSTSPRHVVFIPLPLKPIANGLNSSVRPASIIAPISSSPILRPKLFNLLAAPVI